MSSLAWSAMWWHRSSRIEKKLGCIKNYAILALNCMLKNSKGIILVSGICKRDKNKNIIK